VRRWFHPDPADDPSRDSVLHVNEYRCFYVRSAEAPISRVKASFQRLGTSGISEQRRMGATIPTTLAISIGQGGRPALLEVAMAKNIP
jgi:hypothetical protein